MRGPEELLLNGEEPTERGEAVEAEAGNGLNTNKVLPIQQVMGEERPTTEVVASDVPRSSTIGQLQPTSQVDMAQADTAPLTETAKDEKEGADPDASPDALNSGRHLATDTLL